MVGQQLISVFPDNTSTIKGMFSFLNELNGYYGSRYSIKGEAKSDEDIDCIDKMNHTGRYLSVENYLNITFTFDSPFFVSHYGIMNASPQQSNSYPKSWQLFGRDSIGNLHLIDERKDQNFTDGKAEVAKTYSTRAKKAYSEYVWKQIKNSGGDSYVHLKHFDFFGTLCGKIGECYIPLCHKTCIVKRVQLIPFTVFFSFFISS